MFERLKSAFGFKQGTVVAHGGDFVPFHLGVNMRGSESVSAVYAAVSVIAETIGSLPLHLFHDDANRERAREHPLYGVLHDAPNEWQSAVEFREWMTACYLLHGNAFALIVRDLGGQVCALQPLSPESVCLVRVDGGFQYQSVIDGQLVRLLPHEVFHLRHRAGDNPLWGVSPIAANRATIELAVAEREHGSATFRNGAKFNGILKYPQKLKPEQKMALKESWAASYSGANNAGKTPVLEEGVEYQQVSMTLEDAEWIASRQFSVEEIARIFRVPPTLIGDLRHGNYSNSVELARQFVTISLRRHLVAWEQAIGRQLLSASGRRLFFAEHSVEGLLRGDSVNRAAFYKSGIEAGWMLPSEARQFENLPLIEGLNNAKQDESSQALSETSD